jgi:hypothetical protein
MTDQPATPLPVVESTPAVSEQNAPASTPATTPVPLTEERLTALLGDVEKRISQSAKDAARAAVNKALGVSTKPAPANAEVKPPAQPTPATPPVQPTQPTEPVVETTIADPVLKQAYQLLQQDGVAVDQGVDPGILEAYKLQAAAGIHLQASDPELATIDGSSLFSYLRTVNAAVEAKKARMIEEGTYQEPDTDTKNALALTPGLITGSVPAKSPYEGKTGSETLEMYFTKAR